MTRITSPLTKIAAFGLLALTLSGCGIEEMQKVKVQADLQEAARQASIGQINAAKEWVNRAIAADPGDINTYVLGAKSAEGDLSVSGLFEAVGDFKDEAYYDQQAATNFPNDYRILGELMDAQNMLGDKSGQVQTAQKIITVLEARIAKGSVDADTLAALGNAYWVIGNRQKALSTYQRGISIYVTDWGIYNNFAYEAAEVNSKPDLPQALNAAKTALAKAQAQNSDDIAIAEIQDTLGWVEYRMGQYKQAEADMNDALEAMPRLSVSHYHLGMIYLAEGDKVAAKSEIEKALLISPDYADAKSAMDQLKDVPTPAVDNGPDLPSPADNI